MEMEEVYAMETEGVYPYNLLYSIFGERRIDSETENQTNAELENELSKIIDAKLTKEETEVLFKIYKEGKSINEIAAEKGADPYTIYCYAAASLRKLRHPSSSKNLKKFLK